MDDRRRDGVGQTIPKPLRVADVPEAERTQPFCAPHAVGADQPPQHGLHVHRGSAEATGRHIDAESRDIANLDRGLLARQHEA
jgi:hypothetical protein